MTRKRKTILVVLPVLLLILALLISGVAMAGSGKKTGFYDGKGVIHTLYYGDEVYNAIYHVKSGKLTVTGAIYPKSGPLK